LISLDLDEYSEAAGQVFAEPQDLEDELQRLREQYETEGELQKAQAVEVERERQEQANQAMHDAENGVVHEQPGKKKKKGKNKDTSRAGEVVLSMTIAEYEKERLRQLAEEDE
jgi:transcription factor TFIIIB component B''